MEKGGELLAIEFLNNGKMTIRNRNLPIALITFPTVCYLCGDEIQFPSCE